MDTDVVIVGAGLAGLCLGDLLHRAGREFILVEGRDRPGGRIDALHDGAAFDLGPSWFWPGHRRMAALVARLGLVTFDQYATGAGLYEDGSGKLFRAPGAASMAGSYRVAGGMAAVIAGLAAGIPGDRVLLGQPVIGVLADGVVLASHRRITARHVVLALPPRLAAALSFQPALSRDQVLALQGIPTWMGGQAKFVATYDHAFWRASGFSGDAVSQRGPLGEIHDASAMSGQPAALFGFVATPPEGRHQGLIEAAVLQLGRLFGPQALTPRQTALRDWAAQPLTATRADHAPMSHHPPYGLPPVLRHLVGGRLHLASTEAAPEFGGFLEGALCAAETVAERILAR